MMVIYCHISPECKLPESRHVIGLEHYHLTCRAQLIVGAQLYWVNECMPTAYIPKYMCATGNRAGGGKKKPTTFIYYLKTK